jgi:hypothetical protein
MKLRFIKPWGNYKPGDVMETESKTTRTYLVERYKVAEVYVAPVVPPSWAQETTALKFVSKAAKDKMLKSPAKAKDVTGE